MIGLSYGGFYTLYLTALDKRIKAALCSCYYNDRTYYSNSDWSWFGSANMFEDAEVASLIFPRKLWIQVADNDELFHVSSAKKSLNAWKNTMRICRRSCIWKCSPVFTSSVSQTQELILLCKN